MKSALITGITGQDGSYLAEFLLAKGYKVYGLVRRSSTPNTSRIEHILSDITLIPGDLLDQLSLVRALHVSQADEVYNLAAMSFVGSSFKQPVATGEYNALGVTKILEAIHMVNRPIRFYQASTSEMFGRVAHTTQNEHTPFYPRSPYGVSKLYAHAMTVNYREAYNLFACSGILFNHESPRRGEEFVTRKISMAVAKLVHGIPTQLELGNTHALRDWGYAGDYVEAMWLMLQQDHAADYVIATGELHSVQDFVEEAFSHAGLDWKKHVVINKNLLRPTDVDILHGDACKARRELGWKPRVHFKQLVGLMVDEDIKLIEHQQDRRLKCL